MCCTIINIYNYHDVKTKGFLYVGAMQGHGIIHDDGMYSKQYSSPSDPQEISN